MIFIINIFKAKKTNKNNLKLFNNKNKNSNNIKTFIYNYFLYKYKLIEI